MLLRKPKRGLVSDSDGATGAHRLVGARPVEHGCGLYLGQRKRKIQPLKGVKGISPSCCLPQLGERGGHHRNFHASLKKTRRGFLQILIFLKIAAPEEQLFSCSGSKIHIFDIISDIVCFDCPENLKIIFFRVVYLNTVYGCLGDWYQFDGSPEVCNLSGQDAVFLVTAASLKKEQMFRHCGG